MPERARRAVAALLGLLLALPLLAQAAPRIGLLTMAPGEAYWSRFGHNAIVVLGEDGRATSYNYGYFDFDQQDFLLRFLRGRMLYRLVALPADRDIGQYAEEGRGVAVQWLAMPAPAARELAAFLEWNARPENADYRYDYFAANCSTKVRDALDRALGGELQRQTASPSRGLTARSESRRLAQTLPWLYFGIDFGLGPPTDRPLSRWDEGFIPQRLAEAVREVRIAGRPLVEAEQVLVEHRLAPTPAQEPRWLPAFALAGLLFAFALGTALARPPGALRTAGALTAGAFWVAGGLLGSGLAALWLFTDHNAAWGNANLWLLPPPMLGLLPAVGPLRRDADLPRWLGVLALLVLGAALVGLAHTTLAQRAQANGEWIALLLPAQALLAARLWRQRRR